MPKNKPVGIDQLLSTQDVLAWYNAYPVEPSIAEQVFPIIKSAGKTWKTISNSYSGKTEAADPVSPNSTIPVSGYEGFTDVIGEMAPLAKGYEWTADDIEKFTKLQADYAQLKNPIAAAQLIDYYGNNLRKIREAMTSQMAYLDWALVSNACQYSFLTANSLYMAGLTAMAYPVSAWQKDAVSTAWSDAAAPILADIQSVLDTMEDNGRRGLRIFINRTWFKHVRANTQVQNQTISLVASLVSAKENPNLEAINAMLLNYFDEDVKFVVVSEKTVRESLDGVKTSASPFQDGVAVFAQGDILGHFEHRDLPIINPTLEVYQDFYVIGNYTKVDPSYAKFYGKGEAFPVIDTYADNFYLKINAVVWP